MDELIILIIRALVKAFAGTPQARTRSAPGATPAQSPNSRVKAAPAFRPGAAPQKKRSQSARRTPPPPPLLPSLTPATGFSPSADLPAAKASNALQIQGLLSKGRGAAIAEHVVTIPPLTAATLRQQFVMMEVLQPPLALRERH